MGYNDGWRQNMIDMTAFIEVELLEESGEVARRLTFEVSPAGDGLTVNVVDSLGPERGGPYILAPAGRLVMRLPRLPAGVSPVDAMMKAWENRSVARDEVEGFLVSTVKEPFASGWYEMMVFDETTGASVWQDRFLTREEAEQGHRKMVAALEAGERPWGGGEA